MSFAKTFNVPKHPLGISGPMVPQLGFGTMGLSAYYGQVPSDADRLDFLDKVWASGSRYWDSADIYGDSEELLGKWFKLHPERRADIFLATKFGITRAAPRGDKEYVRQAFEKSIARLGEAVGYVDLYYQHRTDEHTPIEETVLAMKELVKEGRVKYLGLSECSADTLRRACKVHQISAIQMEYSPLVLDIEFESTGVLKAARELGVAIVAYSPLSRGLITGAIRSRDDFEEGDFRKNLPKFSEENFGKNMELVGRMEEIAKRKGCTIGQLTLAWVMAQGDDFFPIPGTKKEKYLYENMGAVDVKVSEEEEKEIRKLAEATEPAGTRYAESGMAFVMIQTPKYKGNI